MMKIQAPLNPSSNISALVAKGADSFYFGLIDEKDEIFTQAGSRRPGTFSNFTDITKLKKIISSLELLNKECYLAANEHFYTKAHLQKLLNNIKSLSLSGLTGVIISDLNLLFALKNNFPELELVASTGLHVLNDRLVEFFNKLGIKHFVLPRHLTDKEIRDMVKANPKCTFEIFIQNDDCPNIDGLCKFVHGNIDSVNYGQACCQTKFIENKNIKYFYDEFASRALSLYDLKGLELTLKISGRDKAADLMEKDLFFIKKLLNSLPAYKNKNAFNNFVQKEYSNIYAKKIGVHKY